MTKINKFKAFIFVVLAIVAIVVAVIYFLDTPVIEEGQEPTVVQKIIIGAKEKLGFILGALGVSALGVVVFCVRTIARNSSSASAKYEQYLASMSEQLSTLKSENTTLKIQNAYIQQSVETLMGKLDIQSGVVFDTYLLSDLPTSVREKISAAKTYYENAKVKIAPIIEAETEEEPASDVETKPAQEGGDTGTPESKTAYFS